MSPRWPPGRVDTNVICSQWRPGRGSRGIPSLRYWPTSSPEQPRSRSAPPTAGQACQRHELSELALDALSGTARASVLAAQTPQREAYTQIIVGLFLAAA